MKIVVTGGAGFIGADVVRSLAHRGDEVLVVDNLESGRPENIEDVLAAPQVQLAVCDIVAQPDELQDAFRGADVTVYRFVSILGRAYAHGHVIDFVDQLVTHPDELHILGDGSQRKSYLEVSDCVDAI